MIRLIISLFFLGFFSVLRVFFGLAFSSILVGLSDLAVVAGITVDCLLYRIRHFGIDYYLILFLLLEIYHLIHWQLTGNLHSPRVVDVADHALEITIDVDTVEVGQLVSTQDSQGPPRKDFFILGVILLFDSSFRIESLDILG